MQPLLFAMLSLMANCALAQVGPPVVLEDYPRYSATPSPENAARLKSIGTALAAAASIATGERMLQVLVVGHADFDAKGREFELEVSNDRARAARDAIYSAFEAAANQMALSDAKVRLISIEWQGRGTSAALYGPDQPMSLRIKNRRVEVSWAPVDVIRPSTSVSTARCAQIITAARISPGRKARIACACNMLRDNIRAGDDYYNFQAFQLALGPRNGRDLSQEQLNEVFRRAKNHYRSDVDNAHRSQPTDDEAFAAALVQVDFLVIFNVDLFVKQTAVAPQLHDRVIIGDIGKKELDTSHIYSCYRGAIMRDLDQNK